MKTLKLYVVGAEEKSLVITQKQAADCPFMGVTLGRPGVKRYWMDQYPFMSIPTHPADVPGDEVSYAHIVWRRGGFVIFSEWGDEGTHFARVTINGKLVPATSRRPIRIKSGTAICFGSGSDLIRLFAKIT